MGLMTFGLAIPDQAAQLEASARRAAIGEAGLRRDIQYGEDLANLQAAESARQIAPAQLPGLPTGGAIAQGTMPQPPAAASAPQATQAGLPSALPPAASAAAAQTDKLRGASRRAAKGAAPTAAQAQAERDRLALATTPAAAADVIQAPVAAGLNVLGRAANLFGANERTDYSMTPVTDYIDRRKAALQGPTEAERVAATRAAGIGAPTAGRQGQYDEIFSSAEQKYGLPAGVLKRLAQTESSLNPAAVNANDPYGGSFGLMQINAQHFGKGIDRAGAMDPATSVDFAARLLAANLGRTNGDLTKALLAYKGASSPEAQARYAPIVQGIVSGAQAPAGLPAQQATAPAAPAAPQQAAQPSLGAIGLPERDLQIAQIQLRQLEAMINSTRDVGQRNQLLAKHMEVQQGMFEAQVGQAAQRAARGDEMALSSLAKTVGVPLLRVGDGTYVEAVQGRDGQYVPVQNAQPYTAQQLAALLYQQASSAVRAQAQAFNAERQKVMFEGQKAGAIAAAKQPYELQMEQAKLNSAVRQEIAKAEAMGRRPANVVALKDNVGNTTGAIIVYNDGSYKQVGGGEQTTDGGMRVVQ